MFSSCLALKLICLCLYFLFFNKGGICVAKPLEIEHVDIIEVVFHTILIYSFSSSLFVLLPTCLRYLYLKELCLRLFFKYFLLMFACVPAFVLF